MSPAVSYSQDDRIGTLTLDRPPLNILDRDALDELDDCLRELQDDRAPQVLQLVAGGPRAFSAGAAVEDHTRERVPAMLASFHSALGRLRSLPSLTMAVIQGHCLGGGLELAMCCDFRLAAATSRFGLPEIQLGCYPPVAAVWLPDRIGWDRALELMVTGRTFDAQEAEAMGLLTWVCDDRELEQRRAEIVGSLSAPSQAATRLLKKAALGSRTRSFDDAVAYAEAVYIEELTATHDMNEGISAFMDKRRPTWRHR